MALHDNVVAKEVVKKEINKLIFNYLTRITTTKK